MHSSWAGLRTAFSVYLLSIFIDIVKVSSSQLHTSFLLFLTPFTQQGATFDLRLFIYISIINAPILFIILMLKDFFECLCGMSTYVYACSCVWAHVCVHRKVYLHMYKHVWAGLRLSYGILTECFQPHSVLPWNPKLANKASLANQLISGYLFSADWVLKL